eukprot:365433-Chlamydomonas_euryale.AAC.1
MAHVAAAAAAGEAGQQQHHWGVIRGDRLQRGVGVGCVWEGECGVWPSSSCMTGGCCMGKTCCRRLSGGPCMVCSPGAFEWSLGRLSGLLGI